MGRGLLAVARLLQGPRQLNQRQWVADRLVENPAPHLCFQLRRHLIEQLHRRRFVKRPDIDLLEVC